MSFTWTSNPQLDLYNRMLCFSPIDSDTSNPYCAGRSREGHCNGEPLSGGYYHFSVALWAGEHHLEADIPVDVCVRPLG